MRERCSVLVTSLLLFLGAWLGPASRRSAGSAAAAAAGKRQVGVWYITIWDRKDEFKHWQSVAARGAAMPSGGPYSADDPEVIARQWRQMRECGVDFLVLDDTNTVHVDNNGIDRSIRAWFDFMDAKPAASRIPIAVVAGGELNQHNKRRAWREAVDYLWQTYARRPSYLRADGRPVLHWYIEKDLWPEWDDPRWTIRRTYHFLRPDGQRRYGGWGYGGEPDPPCNSECMSFHPGWDLSPPGRPRENGDFYRRMWLKALRCRPRPRTILLSDWNGWHEGTALEDSPSWKDTYGDPAPAWYRLLTRGYIAAFKGKVLEGFYYRNEASPYVFLRRSGRWEHQGAYPRGIPVIVLPQGSLVPRGPVSGWKRPSTLSSRPHQAGR